MICKVCHHCGLCEGDCSFVPDKNVLIEQSLSLPVAATIPEFTSTLCDSSALPSEIGIAFDIGTTTIAAAAYTLHDAKKISSCGEQNLQSMFGTDVIARISFALSDDGYNALHTTILIQLNKMMKQLLAEIEPRFLSERKGRALLKRIIIAGNTAMESFAAGVSVKGLSSFRSAKEANSVTLCRQTNCSMKRVLFRLMQKFILRLLSLHLWAEIRCVP